MKKHIVPILSIICIASAFFTACSVHDIPVESMDTPTSVSESVPESEPEPERLSRFDEFVAQYEQENGVELNSTDDEKCFGFFTEICARAYTKEDALTDKTETSEKNQALLTQYIEYLDTPRHEACAFDRVVDRMLQEIAGKGYDLTEEQKALRFYDGPIREGITPENLEQWGCTNEYKDWYIEEYNRRNGESLTEEEWHTLHTPTEEQMEVIRRQAEEAAAAADEESARDLAERQQWMEENFDLYG